MESLAGYVATGVVSLGVGFALRYFEPKVRLVWWSPHQFLFQLTAPSPLNLLTHAITIQNLGRRAAENIEIVHKTKPDFFKLQPALNYTETFTPAGEHIVSVHSLGPKEFFTIEFLSYATLPELLFIRSSSGQAQPIQIQPQRVFPQWWNFAVGIIFLVGLAVVLYCVFWMGIYILNSTGVLSP